MSSEDETLRSIRPREKPSNIPLSLLIVFVLIFPKGGLKIGTVPITWGYLLLTAYAIAHIPKLVASGSVLYLNRERWISLIALVPFQTVLVASLFLLGFRDTGFAISIVTGFIALPWILIWFYSDWIERLDFCFLLKVLRIGIFLIAIYGIGLFGAKVATGHFLEIPYLTVNSGDVGHLEDKNNDRGFAFKLISTYNNGNVYGASVLMLLPLYRLLERKSWRVNIVKLSLLLTLSRTAWIGIILNELLNLFYVQAPPLRGLLTGMVSHSWLKQIVKTSAIVIFMGIAIAVSAAMVGIKSDFFFDKDLGGRAEQLALLQHVTFFPRTQFESITEIVYASIITQFGVIGLFSFLLAVFTPIALSLGGIITDSGSAFKKSITSGLLIYLFIAASDGALLFIPVLLFYWSLVSLLLSRNIVFNDNADEMGTAV